MRRAFRTVEMVERNEFCRAVLKARQAEGSLPRCEILEDVRDYKPTSQAALGAAALLGGFPCQGVSVAGHQQGLHDPRSFLVAELFRIFDSMPKGRLMLLENVSALLSTEENCRRLMHFIVQELRKREMQVYWVTLSLSNCGFQALALVVDFWTEVFSDNVKMSLDLPQAGWNHQNKVNFSSWLSMEQTDMDKKRLQTLGNCVVPAMGARALSELVRMMEAA
ncbi:unnamed protein product [Durusdinium trenchii]|uniref:DNA (cytosine-5-)-methyltransferase n=1 Tax=Durusdinium trenchii TaxID=1381693 RepID=A0ABP0JAR5_9DINO